MPTIRRNVLEIISEIQDPIDAENAQWEKGSAQQWLHCLSLAEELLENTRKGVNEPGLIGLLHSVILPSVGDKSPEVRAAGIKCLGLICLLSCELAKTHLLLFLQVVKNDRDSIKVVSFKAIFDLIMTFGLAPFAEEEENIDEISVIYSFKKKKKYLNITFT